MAEYMDKCSIDRYYRVLFSFPSVDVEMRNVARKRQAKEKG